MNRYSLERMLNTEPFGATRGQSPNQILTDRLQGLQRQKTRMLGSQSQSPLGENAPGFYDNMAAINQAIPALGQKLANPKKAIQFAPDRGRVSAMNQLQAGYNADRIADARGDAAMAGAQARDLEIGNTENELSVAQDMADPSFGDVGGAQARYSAGAGRRSALARMYGR